MKYFTEFCEFGNSLKKKHAFYNNLLYFCHFFVFFREIFDFSG